MRGAVLFAACILPCACSGGENDLFVDVRTDLVPGEEWNGVSVSLSTPAGERMVEEHLIRSDEAVLSGTRVAEFGGLESGRYALTVTLLDGRAEPGGVRAPQVHRRPVPGRARRRHLRRPRMV